MHSLTPSWNAIVLVRGGDGRARKESSYEVRYRWVIDTADPWRAAAALGNLWRARAECESDGHVPSFGVEGCRAALG